MKKLILLSIVFIVGCEEVTQPKEIYGCTDSTATNFDSSANIFDNTCIYSEPDKIYGCDDSTAINYSSLVNHSDGSCIYESDLGEDGIKSVGWLHFYSTADTSSEFCYYSTGSCENKILKPNVNWVKKILVKNILHFTEIDEFLIIPHYLSSETPETAWIYNPSFTYTVEYEYKN